VTRARPRLTVATVSFMAAWLIEVAAEATANWSPERGPAEVGNLNVHVHGPVLDGVYRRGTEGLLEFVEAAAPTDESLRMVLYKVISRVMDLPGRHRTSKVGLALASLPDTEQAFTWCVQSATNGADAE
jgi:hypothetical protein